MAGSALGRLRILDFSRVLAGPLATMILADLGAEVTKVERPGGGDDTRSWGPPYDAARGGDLLPGGQPQQDAASSSTSPTPATSPRRAAWRWRADVVVENFRPGVMAKLGLDYETLAAEQPAASSTARSPASAAAAPAPSCRVTTSSSRRSAG